MAYISGTAAGMSEFLGVVKTQMQAQSWSVLRDDIVPYDKIPSDMESIVSNVAIANIQGFFDTNPTTSGTATSFTLTLPYYLEPNGYMIEGSGTFSLTITATDTDLSIAPIVTNASVNTNNTPITAAKSYKQYNFTITNPANITKLNLFFDTDIVCKRELILYSKGVSGIDNIYVGLQGFTLSSGAQNLTVSSFTGFSQAAVFNAQPNAYAGVYLYLHEKNINYWLNIDKHRILGAVKIYEPTDESEKAAVYQFLHLGYLRAYGMPSQLPAPYCLVGGGIARTDRWSSVNTTLPGKPVCFTPYPHYITAESLVDGWTEINMPYQHDSALSLFAMPVSIFHSNSSEPMLFGEYDGFIKVLATNETRSEDTIQIDNDYYILVQNGKKVSLVDYFGIRMDGYTPPQGG
jgi:hypothetical protein